MKIIDLLNKIANNEEVPKFWWNGCIHQIEKSYDGKYSIFDTYCKKYKRVELNELNDEIKIIEEKPKKIEEINKSYPIFNFDEKSFDAIKDMLQDVYSKQVEVINAVNYLLEKESDK